MSYLKSTFFVVIIAVGLIACGGKSDAPSSKSSSSAKATAKASMGDDDKPAVSNRKGKLIYKQYCQLCHGADGKLGLSGAKDLSISEIDMEERINQITNGKGMMTPYKDILSKEQIQSVAEYLDELIK